MSTATATYSVTEAAHYLGIGKSLAYRLVREGKLPVVVFGSKRRIPKVALDAMLNREAFPLVPVEVGPFTGKATAQAQEEGEYRGIPYASPSMTIIPVEPIDVCEGRR